MNIRLIGFFSALFVALASPGYAQQAGVPGVLTRMDKNVLNATGGNTDGSLSTGVSELDDSIRAVVNQNADGTYDYVIYKPVAYTQIVRKKGKGASQGTMERDFQEEMIPDIRPCPKLDDLIKGKFQR